MKIPFRMPLPQLLRNRYVITGALFVVWILFLDAASVTEWGAQMSENKATRKEIEMYRRQLQVVEHQLKYMHSSNDSLEKYARETYFMKRPNEEIFLIEDK